MEEGRKERTDLADELNRARQRVAAIGRRKSGGSNSGKEGEKDEMTAECAPGDGMAVAKDDRLLFVNGRFLEIFGYASSDEIVGKPVSIMAHPDDGQKVCEYVRAGDRDGNRAQAQEFSGLRKDGTCARMEAYAIQTSFGGEWVSHIYVREATGQKETTKTLGKRLRVEELVSAVTTRLVETSFSETEEGIEDILGVMGEFAGTDEVRLFFFPPHQLLAQKGYRWRRHAGGSRETKMNLLPLSWAEKGLAGADMLHIAGVESLPLDARVEQEAWKALGIGSILAIPLNVSGRLAGCFVFPCLFRGREWPEEETIALGLVAGIFGKALSRNIREASVLRAAEQAREEAESWFVGLADQSVIGIFFIQENRISYVNERFAAIFGCPADAMVGAGGLEDLASPEDRAVVAESFRKRDSGGTQIMHCEFTGLRKDGETVCVEAYGTSVTYGGRPAIIGTLLDESDRKKLEAQLIQSEKMEAIGTLAGGIAHDFNNILMAIQGYTSLMLHHLDSNHPHFGKLQGIEELVESGSDLTKQLLGIASGGTYETRPTDLNEILRKTSTMFARTKREISVQSRYEDEPCVIDADGGQIEQMLLNLYVNAWQAMPDGGSLVLTTENVTLDRKFVRPYSAKPGKYAKISVTDSGVGMDEATKERIFEPFFTTKKRSMGTGLGLSSVYNIVKGHNGIITVASEKGMGSTFCIYLPRSKKSVEKVEPASTEVLRGMEMVLLVDDEETVVSVSRDMLEALGYSVLIARSGREAVAIFEKEHGRIDLVILDVIMPDMGGAETFEEMQRIDPTVKVVLSSGYSLDGMANRIMERGCKAFIQKPFTINLLSQKLREVLQKE